MLYNHTDLSNIYSQSRINLADSRFAPSFPELFKLHDALSAAVDSTTFEPI